MVFSSLTFLFLFLPLTLILYYAVPKKAKNLVLLVMSLVFYAWNGAEYLGLLLFSAAANYLLALGRGARRRTGEKADPRGGCGAQRGDPRFL